MRVTLIFPPYQHKIFSENLSTVDDEFCLAPPIILAYVAAILEQHGHKVQLLDAHTLGLSRERVLEEIKNFQPDVLGFRSETYHFHDALEWVNYLKESLNIPVFTGGINLSLYPKETLSHREIDYGVIGDALDSLPKLINALEYGENLDDVPGIIYKKNGEIVINSPQEKLDVFDSFPFPARHLLPNEAYYSFISQLKNFTIMVTTIGCPFFCTFCAIHPNTHYRVRSAKNVLDEIELCCRDFGIREIDFFDGTFFLPRPRAFEIFEGMKKRRLKIEWSCRTRVDAVDEDILRQASSVGCRQIYYGIESVNTKVLKAIKKDIRIAQIRQAIKWSKKYGIRSMGFFMVGNPSDTRESVKDTIEFAKDLGLDFIQVCRTIAKPGTELDELMIKETGKDYWRGHVLGKKIEGRLPAPWSNLSEIEIEALSKEFYIKFYFRSKIIWNRITQLNSFEELKRYIGAGLKMFMQKSELCSYVLTDTSLAEKILEESSSYISEARKVKVAVIIPTYNEKDNIEKIVSSIIEVLPDAHIVIVDDNSPDGTGVIAQKLSESNNKIFFIHRRGERGLGLSYKDGFKFALEKLDAEYIFEIDADLSHDPRYLPLFLHYAKTYDLVTGSRFLGRVSIKDRAIWRNIISKITKWFFNLILGTNLSDVTTGFKCFKDSLLTKIDFSKIKSKGYAFQIEVSYIAKNLGASIKEIPIVFVERNSGESKMSVRIMLEGVFLILKLSLQTLLIRRYTFVKIMQPKPINYVAAPRRNPANDKHRNLIL